LLSLISSLQIDVCLPGKKCVPGKLQKYDFSYNVSVISIARFRNNCAAMLVESPQTEVVALGRVFKSGTFMAIQGLVTGEQRKFDCKVLKISTCKIAKVNCIDFSLFA
jgi:hypothetical protein